MNDARRGSASLSILLVISALTALILIGLDHRIANAEFEPRTLCRLAARSAADSGIAIGMASLERGARVTRRGVLEGMERADVHYEVTLEPEGTRVRLEANGACSLRGVERAMRSKVVIYAERVGAAWKIVSRDEAH